MNVKRLVCGVLAMSLWGCQSSSEGERLNTPVNFKLQQIQFRASSGTNEPCNIPDAYTGTLDFPSKYEGSGRSRDTLNEMAKDRYQSLIEPIDGYAKFISALAKRLHRSRPSKADARCFYQGLEAWASRDALMDKGANGTGKAVRKWTLATLASHYLVFQDLQLADTGQAETTENWFSALAYQVKEDYSHRPLRKVNNHDYWASWSVMLVAVITNDRALYDWSVAVLRTAIDQIDEHGLLPNELRRASRAFEYHNFAMLPLAPMAAFAYANGDDLTQQNQQALFRLAAKILQPGAQTEFGAIAGVSQAPYKLAEKGHLTWVPALLSISENGVNWTDFVEQHAAFRQHGYSRLGGNACLRFPCPSSST